MAVSCTNRTVKIILLVCNCCFFLTGALLIASAIYVRTNWDMMRFADVMNADGNDGLLDGATVFLSLLGVTIIAVGVLGCCAAASQRSFLLLVYAVLVGIIVGLQIIGGLFTGIFAAVVEEKLRHSMNESVAIKYTGEDRFSQSWDYMQYKLSCCGVYNASDWTKSTWGRTRGESFPVSCCALRYGNAYNPTIKNRAACKRRDPEYFHFNGCHHLLVDYFKAHLGIMVGFAFSLIIFEILCIIFACLLRKATVVKVGA